MKAGKIISEEIRKLIGKLTYKIQKVILYLYPEMTNFQEDIRKEKIKLKKEEILKIIAIVLLPFIIAGAYRYHCKKGKFKIRSTLRKGHSPLPLSSRNRVLQLFSKAQDHQFSQCVRCKVRVQIAV